MTQVYLYNKKRTGDVFFPTWIQENKPDQIRLKKGSFFSQKYTQKEYFYDMG